MNDEDLHVELARLKVDVAKLTSNIRAIENILYQKQAEKLPLKDILKDLDVALSDRLQVVNENEVRAREYFHRKDDWNTVNKLLKQNGFNWVSEGKNSRWTR